MDREDPGKILDYRGPQLFRHKIFLAVTGFLLFLGLAGGVYSIIVLRGQSEAATAAKEPLTESGVTEERDLPVTAEVLPQQRREHEDLDRSSWSPFDGAADPFAGPMTLTGVVVGGRGGNMAIIESGGTSYIVHEGEYVDDLWVVRRVYREMVILRAHDREVSLYFDQPPATRTIEFEHMEEEGDLEEGA